MNGYSDLHSQDEVIELRSRVEELERENGVLISNNANYVSVIEKIYTVLECDDYTQDPEMLIMALQEELSRLREMVRWIPVGERLPDVGEPVLCRYKSNGKYYFMKSSVSKEGKFRASKNTKPVTHWMPMPEPPEVENE